MTDRIAVSLWRLFDEHRIVVADYFEQIPRVPA